MGIIYWLIRIFLYYTAYENMEVISNLIEFTATTVIIYYMPNMSFKLMSSIMNEIGSGTK